jgi:hypothetical protein
MTDDKWHKTNRIEIGYHTVLNNQESRGKCLPASPDAGVKVVSIVAGMLRQRVKVPKQTQVGCLGVKPRQKERGKG